MVLLHAGLAIAIKILFFAHNSPVAKEGSGDGSDSGKGNGAPDPMGDADKAKGDSMAMLFRA